MKTTRLLQKLSLIAASLLAANMAQAALHDQGNGMIYDDVLNITWQQNANLAASNTFGVSGINADGTMSWNTAQSWIAAMNAANYLGYHDWRLPKLTPVNGVAFDYNVNPNALTPDINAYDGSADFGFHTAGTNSELGNLFYATLGNPGVCSTIGQPTGCENGMTVPLSNVGPFQNLAPVGFWIGTPSPWDRGDGAEAWVFHFRDGGQDPNPYTDQLSVWAVRPVPEPETYALMLAGLGLVGFAARRRRSA